MRAAVLERFGEPLAVREVADPAPGPGEVLVRVRAVGLCGTDLKLRAGELPGVTLPLIPGHEVAGEIVAGAAGLETGQRVAAYHYEPCGRCRWCRAGQDTLCPTAGRVGRNRDGGLAELIVLRAENALPTTAEFAAAAVAMDAVTTCWRALRKRAALRAGETVLIVGAGGVGLHAVQVAVGLGARIAAVDPSPAARQRALELGAELVLEPAEAESALEWSGGGVDVALEASGRTEAIEPILSCVAPGGRIVCCGYSPAGIHEIASQRLVLDELSLLGSRAGSREDAREALAAVEAGAIEPVIAERLALEDVNRALDAIAAGSVVGRLAVAIGE
jgi:2-desacetyl-2-hydroxyethyl bacteriochlorophyllide A dehydrogenase